MNPHIRHINVTTTTMYGVEGRLINLLIDNSTVLCQRPISVIRRYPEVVTLKLSFCVKRNYLIIRVYFKSIKPVEVTERNKVVNFYLYLLYDTSTTFCQI